ncbi:acetyl-CoA synthetase-like protein [Parathielavia hyrcaniae]|uniref:Acetyl-CoA synthetase-like protein n=1 Tax=Parathielavia hyrcaniae TaxID=113614 RepID=A0AAN6PXZ0_9PEZI|nr:acetyl-CoA synthetase-like protein [Parathielavia hyrcaniae]
MLSPAALVDKFAADTPQGVWVKANLSSDNGELTWQDITWVQLRRAVDLVARQMEDDLGAGAGDETLGYIGGGDLRYAVVLMAALKCGYKPMLLSPRNSREGHASLLKRTQCSKLAFSPELRSMALDLAGESNDFMATELPALPDLFAAPDSTHYESLVKGEMEDHETVAILHSSGTTGLPKPIYVRSGVLRVGAKLTTMPVPEGRRSMVEGLYSTKLMVSTLPFFHIFGVILLVRCIHHQQPLVMLPFGKPPTAEFVLETIAKAKPTGLVCPPSILEDLCKLPGGLEAISTLDTVLFGGAPLARSCGDNLSKVTNLYNGIGSTEAWIIPNLVAADPADWDYHEWNPNVGIVMEPTGDDKLAELVIRRQPGNDYQTVFHNFPDLNEWRTNDLFERHPTKPTLWKYVGRIDDILVLSNGEKLNPVTFEKIVEGHPGVSGVLVVGAGQFQASLLVEPNPERVKAGADALVQELWSTVEEANIQYPAHARVWRSMITLASPEKPFKRTAKGSVMRQATYRLYEAELKALYDKQQQPLTNGHSVNGVLGSSNAKATIRSAVKSVLVSRAEPITDDTNFFSLGMDSLQVMQLLQTLSLYHITCTTRMVYENPSVDLLLRAVTNGQANDSVLNSVSREEKMSAMIHRYSKFVPMNPPSKARGALPRAVTGWRSYWRPRLLARVAPTASSGQTILLVGSTGALGTHLLHELINNPSINRVYCLNRSAEAIQKQITSFSDRDLGTINFTAHPKVQFLKGETHQENFGLDPDVYAELARDVDLLISNAWPVNFNSSLESFEGVIAGTKRCVDFAASSARRAHVVFVSSVASVMNFSAVRRRDEDAADEVAWVPEEFDADNSLPAKQGYGESKHVASCILEKAARRGVISATILRVGQLAGTAEGKGLWNQREWVPTLIKTSKSLGKIPRSLGPANDGIAWVPLDMAAKVILDLVPPSVQGTMGNLRCFNVVNPQVAPWNELAAVVQQHHSDMEPGQTLDAVEFEEWLNELGAVGVSNGAEEAERFPALKLLDFFEGLKADGEKGLWRFETEKGVELSPTMAQMGAVNGELMRKWLDEWEF